MPQQEQDGDSFCFSSVAFFNVVIRGNHRCSPDGIISIQETPERLCGSECVSKDCIEKVVHSKWVKYAFKVVNSPDGHWMSMCMRRERQQKYVNRKENYSKP